MVDIVDTASDYEQQAMEVALANHKPKSLLVRHFCEDCDVVIPGERIKALAGRGVTRCVDCQSIFENKKRIGGAV